jgi:hypothetical protein
MYFDLKDFELQGSEEAINSDEIKYFNFRMYE